MLTILAALAVLAVPQANLDRFAQVQAAPTRSYDHTVNEPADWACAEPIIARNANNRDARGILNSSLDLAHLIAEECARPYNSRPLSNQTDRTLESMERQTYRSSVEVFTYEIAAKLDQARRRDRIRLN